MNTDTMREAVQALATKHGRGKDRLCLSVMEHFGGGSPKLKSIFLHVGDDVIHTTNGDAAALAAMDALLATPPSERQP